MLDSLKNLVFCSCMKVANPKWDWISCNYNLETEINRKVVVLNLQPSIILTNPNDQEPDPHVKLFIDTQKSLQYTTELGWNWHKSWILPNIFVRLEVHIYAVKGVIEQPDNFRLVDVGLRGSSKLELVNGQAILQKIKFSSTSYKNEEIKFHLVLCIYTMKEDDDIPKILCATISPSIFVDSRPAALDKKIIHKNKMSTFVEPFLPENLDKKYIKRENKRKSNAEIKIDNDLDGLFNYLTAQNLRYKVKHPLFLSFQFSSCVKLYYNKNILSEVKSQYLLEFLQARLSKEHCLTEPMNPMSDNLDDKFFILYVLESPDNQQHKKNIEAIEALACPSLGIIQNLNKLPQFFDDIAGGTEGGITDLINTYKKCYSDLLALDKTIRSTEVDQEEDEDHESQSDKGEGQDSQSDEEDERYSPQQPNKKQKPNTLKKSNQPSGKQSQVKEISVSNNKSKDSGDRSKAEENQIKKNEKPASKTKQQKQQQPELNAKNEKNNNTNVLIDQQQPKQQTEKAQNVTTGQSGLQQQQANQQQKQELTQQPVASIKYLSNTLQNANLSLNTANLSNLNNSSLPPQQQQSSQQSTQQHSSQQQQQLQQLQQLQQQSAQALQQQQQYQNQQAQNQLQQFTQSQIQQWQQQQQLQQRQYEFNSSQQQFNLRQIPALNQQQQHQQQFMRATMEQSNPLLNYVPAQVAAGNNPQVAGIAQQQMMIPNFGFQNPNHGMNPAFPEIVTMPMGFQMGGMPNFPMQPQFPQQTPFGQTFMIPGQAPQVVSQMTQAQNQLNQMAQQLIQAASSQGVQPQGNPQAPGFNHMMGMNQQPPGQQE